MRYPMNTLILVVPPMEGSYAEFLSIRLRINTTVAEPEYNGMEITLPYVKDPAQAKALWEELAKVMTALEAYIGRNSD